MRYTEYHSGKAVIADKSAHAEAMKKLAHYEDMEEAKKNAEQRVSVLPILKNNEMRRNFIEDYTTWPVWFAVPETSETYYRYNLPDGSSIIVCSYKTYQKWKEQYTDEKPDTIRERYYLLTKDNKYLNDCNTSITALIDHLRSLR
ncbi:MAG: hypothetical protein E6686_03720 [Lachnospiraceae bacterium]|nr:hypothetical protein [Lachnospiraceae bacterium]